MRRQNASAHRARSYGAVAAGGESGLGWDCGFSQGYKDGIAGGVGKSISDCEAAVLGVCLEAGKRIRGSSVGLDVDQGHTKVHSTTFTGSSCSCGSNDADMRKQDWSKISYRLLQPAGWSGLYLACQREGEYAQATDRDGLVRYFKIERITDEKDYYGVHKEGSDQEHLERKSERTEIRDCH
jgi:hypothetical protein